MKNFILLSLLLVTSACAMTKQIQSNLLPTKSNSLVGQTEEDIIAQLGPPQSYKTTAAGDRVMYYNRRWYLLKKGMATEGEYFSKSVYNIELKSFFDKSYESKLKGKSFVIYSGMENLKSNDLEFKASSNALAHVLQSAGLIPSKNEKADYVFLVSFGISDPIQDVEIEYIPTFAWVPGQTTTMNGNVGGKSFTAQSSSSGNIQNTGYRSKIKKNISYMRFLFVNAYENTKDLSTSNQIWKISMKSLGYTDDVQSVLGVMFGTLQTWIFKSSEGKEVVTAATNDPMATLAFE